MIKRKSLWSGIMLPKCIFQTKEALLMELH
nr:MAG TPA: hypothetical protein [Caudoviricetes sp.]